MRSQHTLPVRGARFRCGCPKSLANVTYRRKHVGEPYVPVCKACERVNAVKSQRTRLAKKHPVRKVAIVRPNVAALIEECRDQYRAAIAPQKPTGRPRTPTTTHSEAA